MSLLLITGPANAGKTGAMLDAAAVALAEGAPSTLVVPKPQDARRLEQELSGKTPLGIRVLTFGQLVRDLWSMFGDGRRIIERYERETSISRLISEATMGASDPTVSTPGFREMLKRLASHEGSTARPADALPPWRPALEILAQYWADLSTRGLIEPWKAADALAVAGPRGVGFVGFMRFDTLNAQIASFAVGLAEDNDVACALTWEDGFAPTRANDGLVALLEGRATDRQVIPGQEPRDELELLGRSLFGGAAGVRSGGCVALGTASGIEAECALLASLVAAEVRDGAAPERIAMVLPNTGTRRVLLEAALAGEGVDADFCSAMQVGQTPFGRALRGLLALATGLGGRSEALAFMASPFSSVSPVAAHAADRQWRLLRLTNSRDLLAVLAKLGGGTHEIVGLARKVGASPVSPESLGHWKKLVDSLLSAGVGSRGLDGWGVDAAAHRRVSQVVAEMAETASAHFTVADVIAALAVESVGTSVQERPGAVQVIRSADLGSRRFDVVIVGGMSEKETPLVPVESEQAEMIQAQAPFAAGEPSDLKRLQFYSLVTRARKRLVLVRQGSDSSGGELTASALWDDVLNAYRARDDEMSVDSASALPSFSLSRAQIEGLAPYYTRDRRRLREQAAGLRFDAVDRAHIASHSGLAATASDRVFSATEIETYLECPYRWFYERVVRPEEIDAEIDSRTLGTLAHGLLGEFYRRFGGADPARRVCPENVGMALTAFDELAREHTNGASALTVVDEIAIAQAVATARRVVSQDSRFLPGFIPAGVEVEFGVASPFRFGGGAFRGRIDRIDCGPESLFVTDYKSSRDIAGVGKFEQRGKVQAVVYAVAAETRFDRAVAGSMYRSMRSGRLRGFWRADLLEAPPLGSCESDGIDEAGYRRLVARTEERVADAVESMRAGDIPRSPAVRSACTYCALMAVCEAHPR